MKFDIFRFRFSAIAVLLLSGILLLPLPAHAVVHRHDDDGSDSSDSASDNSDSGADKQNMNSDDPNRDDPNNDDERSDNSGHDADEARDESEVAPKPAPAPRPSKGTAAKTTRPSASETDTKSEPKSYPELHGNWWHPHPGTSWQIQYVGKLDTSRNVAAYDVDLFDVSADTVKSLHDRGIKVICYFSAGSYEQWRPDARDFPKSILGKSNGWKDEKWLDIRKLDILKPIMSKRIELAAEKHCDAIDPDNVEGFDNRSGFPLTYKDQITFNTMIADLGHQAGMAVGLKNDLDQVDSLVDKFDFQVNEQCFEYDSCHDLRPFIAAGKPVFNIEYKVDASQFCSRANAMNFDSLQKKLELDAWVKPCR